MLGYKYDHNLCSIQVSTKPILEQFKWHGINYCWRVSRWFNLLSKIDINRSLWVFGFLQAVSNLAFTTHSIVGKKFIKPWCSTNIETFCGGWEQQLCCFFDESV